MRFHRNFTVIAAAAVLTALPVLTAALASSVSTGKYLYTKPDPSSSGGIKGTVVGVHGNIQGVFALPPSEPRFVYKAKLSGSGSFSFSGLPADRYDLVVLLDDACHEGLSLHRGENTLTKEDLEKINTSVQKSEPFFNEKTVHRVQGETGRGNMARCFAEYIRTRKSLDINDAIYTDHRRSYRLIVLKDVGPGWQFVRSREIDVRFFKPGGKVAYHYSKELSRIRVIDAVKDVGQLDLR